MRRSALLVTTIGLLGWSAMTAIGACGGAAATELLGPLADAGGSSVPSGSSGASGSTSSSGASGSSSGNTSSSGGVDDAGVKDAGQDANTSSGGPVGNPGKISCGTTECSGRGLVCCVDGPNAKCENAAGVGSDCNGVSLACDETADCPVGQACCFGNGDSMTARCRLNCGNDQPRLCKSNAECGPNGTCTQRDCKGAMLKTCGPCD